MPPSHSSMQIAVLGQDNNNWSDHSDESQTPGSQWTPDSLQLQMYTMEMSLIEQEASNWDIQDPDLMPTINDWYLCYRYLTKGGTIPYPQSISHDAEAFMRNFFSLPPVYR
ncbi:hypothetical protein BCR33DRAFT_720415 [Rhizoclosmatium globosum]|uniref:Uncharacterized protein n=1 Tax=Rhizoclosmatium globosum TaxID=329046 RepID=A0A1Y2BWN7_9FUNG|nr:hypothetical protein BCR33DRAFT_720415 [Rhizoclosmatium globosum]|eukprot:ORY39180.1 hypothetical protein BCR33DRAFT_720415 [Rhizoclosmatium globosum]